MPAERDNRRENSPTRILRRTAAAVDGMRRCAEESVPLTDTATGVGLYTHGNKMPEAHRSAAPALEPIDGVIGFAAIGMSNGLQEWAAFTSRAHEHGALADGTILANGAVRYRTMSEWNDPRNRSWEHAIDRIATAGIGPQHVQVVWMKMGSKLHELGFIPTRRRVDMERAWLENILAEAVVQLPNLRRVYVSSRIFVGYARSTNHQEPATGFDNGLAVKAVVGDSVAGRIPVWVAWGPYLWANGAKPREDGLAWLRDDFEDDGLHPSQKGARKVGSLLFDFFSTEPGTRWMLSNGTFRRSVR